MIRRHRTALGGASVVLKQRRFERGFLIEHLLHLAMAAICAAERVYVG